MDTLQLELKKRNRSYGIITWPFDQDKKVRNLLNNANKVSIEFENKIYPDRKVDYKYRRISFGKKRMKRIQNDFVKLKMNKGNLMVH